jgi:peptidoglycan/LPS O-acetylase OafA/YrhL
MPRTVVARSKNTDIEALRAIAVALVMMCHLNVLLQLSADNPLLRFTDFWGGVDIFFCVSGFVIAGSLLRAERAARFRDMALPFYVRRIFRIWPAAFFWLACAILAARYFNASGAFGHFRDDALDAAAAVAQVANIYFSTCLASHHGRCAHEIVYWSLSLEEQFYVLFPLLLWWVGPARLRWVLAAAILVQFPLARDAPDLLWFVRTDAISYGVLIALSSHRERWSAAVGSHPRLAAALGVALIAAVAALSLTPDFRFDVALIALAAAGLVALASCDRDVLVSHRRLRALILWGGSRSYGLYLVHLPCFWATHEIFYRIHHGARADDWWARALTGTVLVAATSELSYRFIESPLRQFGRRLAARTGAAEAAFVEAAPRAARSE